jgi:dUTP pyrophosphatase
MAESIVKFKKLDPEAKAPTRKHPTDAGMDVYSLEETVIPPHSHRVMKTGVTFDFPENTVVFAWPKSRNEHVVGAGVIDCSYQGEILIKVINPYNYALQISKHTGIAQLVITPVLYPVVEEANEIHEIKSERGDTGGIVGNS